MRRQEICEEWRDYYYNANTGEFLGWAGEPYWAVCLDRLHSCEEAAGGCR